MKTKEILQPGSLRHYSYTTYLIITTVSDYGFDNKSLFQIEIDHFRNKINFSKDHYDYAKHIRTRLFVC